MLVGGAGGGAGAGAAAGAVWGAAAGAVCTRPLRVGMCQLKREPFVGVEELSLGKSQNPV